MKLSNIIIIYFVMLLVLSHKLHAWENKQTHPSITNNSLKTSVIDSYIKAQLGWSNGITEQLYWDFPQDIEIRISRGDANPNQKTRSISEWLCTGSIIEDTEESKDPRRALAAWRPRHHFHDPIRNAGLDNHTDHLNWAAPAWSTWLPLGQSAMNWAIFRNGISRTFNNI